MAAEPERKPTRFSRWREERRIKAQRERETGLRVKAERADRARTVGSHDHHQTPDGGPMGGGGLGGM